jgi:hypothetical protein
LDFIIGLGRIATDIALLVGLTMLFAFSRRRIVSGADERATALSCPRCRSNVTAGAKEARCGACDLRFRLEIIEERCTGCGYSLYGLTMDRCPECGTSRVAPAAPTEPA